MIPTVMMMDGNEAPHQGRQLDSLYRYVVAEKSKRGNCEIGSIRERIAFDYTNESTSTKLLKVWVCVCVVELIGYF